MKLSVKSRENLARQLREVIKEREVTYAEIASLSGVHPSQVSRICRGEFKTASANLVQICTALGLAEDRSTSPAPNPSRQLLEKSIGALWDQTPEDADRLLKLMRQLAELRRQPRKRRLSALPRASAIRTDPC
ncbi:helix-turn-helix transcriptional regulator [Caulobacter sp. FWC2]|uniref:helix-turn-helix domain-containing protein n=1 Tax=Caulobacter sp. FWC2 TaxID=69664 RepID=UPI001303F7FC|nr:helix-turn-helix transcriptional regulator [Caulobacter sp. FWC2]